MWLRRFKSPALAPHVATGKCGEGIAARYLKKIGFDVWHKNIRVGRRHEIDLIAFDPKDAVIVFVEVKTRSVFHPDFRPELSFTHKKRLKFQHAIRQWIGIHEYDGGYRMDLVCVADSQVVNHVQNLDWLSGSAF